jgi:hypothetical protein
MYKILPSRHVTGQLKKLPVGYKYRKLSDRLKGSFDRVSDTFLCSLWQSGIQAWHWVCFVNFPVVVPDILGAYNAHTADMNNVLNKQDAK